MISRSITVEKAPPPSPWPIDMDGAVDIPLLVERLGSPEDGARKMAAFKLQANVGDPSFADVFVSSNGLPKLRALLLNASGNTLAYSLRAFSGLLEVDKGWDVVDQGLVRKVRENRSIYRLLANEGQIVELIVTHPLVNILRGAMSVLVSIVSHQFAPSAKPAHPDAFGFKALKPAIAEFPQFLESLVDRLSSSDPTLSMHSLQLINALMRDAVTNSSDGEWPKFIKRLQDLGVIRAVYLLMQGPALQDLAQPLLEFQALTKVLLRKWRNVRVDFDKLDHRRAIRVIYQASKSEKDQRTSDHSDYDIKTTKGAEKWKKLGFKTSAPAGEFEEVGFLGMMDLSDFVRRSEDGFQKLVLEQSTQDPKTRCPIAAASIAVTSVLYDHFEIDKSDLDDAKAYLALDSRSSIDKLFSPMLLQWSRIHTAGLQAYLRLWKATGASESDGDFDKITELVRILIEAVVGGATRDKEITAVEDEIQAFELQRLRELQMELLELSFEEQWRPHLDEIRAGLDDEALTFMKEQRIRCLLAGSWFFLSTDDTKFEPVDATADKQWRFARLSHNRRSLHYADFATKEPKEPTLADLPEKIELSSISSVVSNISQTATTSPWSSTESLHPTPSSAEKSSQKSAEKSAEKPQTRILINGLAPHRDSGHSEQKHHRKTSSTTSHRKEIPLLALFPLDQTLAAEWLDGLLMLLGQNPITSHTKKLLELISWWGMRVRLLNVRFDSEHTLEPDDSWVPSREGLDDDYYYGDFPTN